MTFTRAWDLIGAGIVAAVLVNLLLRLSYGDLPPLPLLAGTTLLAFAVAEVVLGATLRARIQRRPGTRPVQALAAAKAVLLAKASSLAGAITAGAWLGVLSHVLPLQSRQVSDAVSDTVTASIGMVSAAALVAAGLWLEHCCRTPDPPDDRRTDEPSL